MARKLCTVCEIRTQYTGTGVGVDDAPHLSDMCNLCYTEGGWENTHSDEGHDAETMDDDCWICHPNLNRAARPAKERTGHTNTAPKGPAHSHNGCTHNANPQGRAACRKANRWDDTKGWIAR
jgi:hypothetical protein